MPFSLRAITRLRTLLGYRNWTKKEWIIAAAGFTIIVFAFALISNSRHTANKSELNHLFELNPGNEFVKITLSSKAKERGACM
ncbi:hypothetical protein L6164_003298 [Bauhinia variegata]|uniref:Uncharacterized protein n=1 Tax=Bauhinia variegata TaxID=167791 RepID=A0ACB9Q362_BAUVA|nr:hypothetical protein L6164_003298 [Bauhinia variegata]